MLDIYSVGLIVCLLCMIFKQASTKLEYFVSAAILLAVLNIGSHWSNFLTVAAHTVSIKGAYLYSTIFAGISTMSIFVLVQLQKRLRLPQQRTHELDRRNWNFQSLWLISRIHCRSFLRVHFKNHLLAMLNGFLVGLAQERLSAGEEAHILSNTLLWAAIVGATIVVGKLNNERITAVLFPILMLLLAAFGLSTSNLQLFGLAAYHCSEIANIMSLGQLNNYIYYVNER